MKSKYSILILILLLVRFGWPQNVIENRWNMEDIGDNSDWVDDIAIDDSGYVYFCATLEGSGFIAVGRLTPDLKKVWISSINFGDNVGTAVGLALDDSSLYVASNSGTFSNRNALTYRYEKYTGKRIYNWYDNARNTGDYITDIKLDKYSNVIVTGTSYYKSRFLRKLHH